MHVALLCNTSWLDEELSLFRYLVVGLLDEQVRVAQVLPEKLPAQDTLDFGARLSWKDTSWSFLRRHRLRRLAGQLDELGVDLIHAMDGRLWSAAIDLAQRCQCPAVLTAGDARDVALAQKLLPRHAAYRLGIAATSQPLLEAVSRHAQAEHLCQLVRPGVHALAEAQPALPEPGTLCAVISGDNRFGQEYEALFLGLKPVVERHPQAQFFLDAWQGQDQHLLWQAAQRMGLLAHISLVPRRLGHHEMLLRADVLIHPQPAGRSRGLTLQAMARGIPVLAQADPWVDHLVQDRTAWLIPRADPALWTQELLRVIEQPGQAQALGQSARQWVLEQHAAAQMVSATIGLYRQTADAAFPFPPRK